jgi:hypothetical protein
MPRGTANHEAGTERAKRWGEGIMAQDESGRSSMKLVLHNNIVRPRSMRGSQAVSPAVATGGARSSGSWHYKI